MIKSKNNKNQKIDKYQIKDNYINIHISGERYICINDIIEFGIEHGKYNMTEYYIIILRGAGTERVRIEKFLYEKIKERLNSDNL